MNEILETTTTTTTTEVLETTLAKTALSETKEVLETTTTTETTINKEIIIENIDPDRDYENESDRALAHLQRIEKLEPIVGADLIEMASVLGWKVIVKKNLYKIGDIICYCEIDSILPPWEYFINDKLDARNFKIKTIKLRGEISQGYCIPVHELIKHPNKKIKPIYHQEDPTQLTHLHDEIANETIEIEIGKNFTQFIGIKKITEYIAIPRGANGSNRRMYTFPSFITKTDQTRIQNVPHYFNTHKDLEFEVTEKLEGSSITVFKKDDKVGICSRNFLLEEIGEESDIHQAIITGMDLLTRLKNQDLNIAIQGEILGPKLQGNIYALKRNMYKIFDIYLIDKQRYATHDERIEIITGKLHLDPEKHMAPIISKSFTLNGKTLPELLAMADGFSLLKESKPKVLREGIVFKSKSTVNNTNPIVVSFKVISNQYLLKKK